MAYDNARNFIREKDARLVHVSALSQFKARTVLRFWDKVSDKHSAEILEFADSYISYDSGAFSERQTITDPIGSKEKIEGTFRLTHNRMAKHGEEAGYYQALTEVFETNTLARLGAREFHTTQDHSILKLFGLKEGEGENKVVIIPYVNPSEATKTYLLETVTDAQLVAQFGSGWHYAQRKFEQNIENNTGTFMIAFSKATWRRWDATDAWATETVYGLRDQVLQSTVSYDCAEAHTAETFGDDLIAGKWVATHNPDHTAYENAGEGDEVRRKTWSGFDKADLALVLGAIVNDDGGVGNDSGMHVTTAEIADNGDGSITAVQGQIRKFQEQATDSTRNLDGEKAVNPHGLVSGTLNQRKTIFRHFRLTDSLGDTGPDNWELVDQDSNPEGNGFYTRIYIYEKASWNAWLVDSVPRSPTITQDTNEGRNGAERRKEWHGIKKSDLATAMTAIKNDSGTVGNDTGYHVVEALANDNRDGSITLIQTQVALVSEVASSSGKLTGERAVDAHGLVPGKINTKRSVYRNFDSTELAAISDGVPSDSYVLVDASPQIQSNGLWTKVFEYELPEWDAWALDETGKLPAPDKSTSIYPDREGEGYIREWYGIKLSSLSSAMAGLQDETKLEVDYAENWHIQRVEAVDRKDGSIALSQIIVKEVSESADSNGNLVGKERIHPHSMSGSNRVGTIEKLRSVYRNFPAADIPDEDDFGDYTLVRQLPDIQQDGLFTRIYEFEKATWDGVWDNNIRVGASASNGFNKTETHQATGISEAEAATALAAAISETSSNGDYVLADASLVERAHGEFAVSRRQKLINKSLPAPVIVEKQEQMLGKNGYVRRAWYRITASIAKEQSAYAADYKYFKHVVIDHGDGAFTLLQTDVNVYNPAPSGRAITQRTSRIRTKPGTDTLQRAHYNWIKTISFHEEWSSAMSTMVGSYQSTNPVNFNGLWMAINYSKPLQQSEWEDISLLT